MASSTSLAMAIRLRWPWELSVGFLRRTAVAFTAVAFVFLNFIVFENSKINSCGFCLAQAGWSLPVQCICGKKLPYVQLRAEASNGARHKALTGFDSDRKHFRERLDMIRLCKASRRPAFWRITFFERQNHVNGSDPKLRLEVLSVA